MVNVLTYALHRWAETTDTALDDQLVPLISKAAKVTVFVLAALLILQNMGISISGLIAGLGVGGLAVALAAQKGLSDLFGSILLLIDRPFVQGDWVKSPDGSVEGVVERIGFRSTRIRTFEKTLITVPNSRLADFIVDNMNERPIRRVWITVGVTYDTTSHQMREAVAGIQQVLRTHPEVDQEFFLVNFTDFGASSLDIMVYYFTSTTVWNDYLRIREDVNLKIMDLLESRGLSVAFPTRTVRMEWEAGRGPVPPQTET
jgi:MscS family membrane protein